MTKNAIETFVAVAAIGTIFVGGGMAIDRHLEGLGAATPSQQNASPLVEAAITKLPQPSPQETDRPTNPPRVVAPVRQPDPIVLPTVELPAPPELVDCVIEGLGTYRFLPETCESERQSWARTKERVNADVARHTSWLNVFSKQTPELEPIDISHHLQNIADAAQYDPTAYQAELRRLEEERQKQFAEDLKNFPKPTCKPQGEVGANVIAPNGIPCY